MEKKKNKNQVSVYPNKRTPLLTRNLVLRGFFLFSSWGEKKKVFCAKQKNLFPAQI